MNADPSHEPVLRHAEAVLAELRAALARQGIADAGPTLRPVPGLLSHYDFREACIYVGIHDPDRAESRLMAAFLAALLGLDQAATVRLFALLTPWTIAHELAHHVRHQAGLFGADLWAEEVLAHRFAAAFVHGQPEFPSKEIARLLDQALADAGPDAAKEKAHSDTPASSPNGSLFADPSASLRQHLTWVRAMIDAPPGIDLAEILFPHGGH